MSIETETLRTRLHQLRQSGVSLAQLLLQDAARLESDGWPPTRTLSDDLRRFRDQQISLASLFQLGTERQGSLQFRSLNEMDAELDDRDTARQATAIARSILKIEAQEGVLPAGMEQLHRAATEMIATQGMNNTREQIRDLIQGTHPWCSLLQMIQSGDSLSDSEWTVLNSSIEASFGRPMALAAARGRLKLPTVTDSVTASAADSSAAPTQVASHANAISMETSQEPLIVTEGSTVTPAPVINETPIIQQTLDGLTSRPGSRSSFLNGLNDLARSESSTISDIASENDESIAETEVVQIPKIDEAISSVIYSELPTIPPVAEAIFPTSPISTSTVSEDPLTSIEVTPVADVPHDFASSDTSTGLNTPSVSSQFRNAPASFSSSSIFEDESDDADELVHSEDLEKRRRGLHSSEFIAEPDTTAPSPLAELLLAQARFTDATGPSAQLATAIVNGPEADRLRLLPDLIFHLIHEGRPGLAFHLSRCLESRPNVPRSFVPSWLIRTWTFGHALLFPKGQLAGLLQDDFQSRTITGVRTPSSDWNLAYTLMVRAATLRPAIIAPISRAASVLRSFELRQDCVQLYNFCTRIAVSGERIQGVYPGLFKQTTANAPYSDQLSTLRNDITQWQVTSDANSMKYQIATQLFQKTGWSLRAGMSQRYPEAAQRWVSWQTAIHLSDSLIAPVLADQRMELTRVKAAVEEISSRLTSDHDDESRQVWASPEIRAYLRQAITFAQRWISLHSQAATSASQNYLPQAAVELRTDIESRHDMVMEELQTLGADHTSFEVRMAVACLMLSVQEVRDLVDPNRPTESQEADPRQLLHSELLKIPDLRLSPNWEPESDYESLEDEILRFLSQPQPDWASAFQLHLGQGNHPMAERILSLSVWSAAEREALQGILASNRGRQRTDFGKDLQRVQQILKESIQLEILPDTERVGVEARLTRLQRMLDTESDVSSGILELERVRDSLVKRREREADRIRTRLRKLSGLTTEDESRSAAQSQRASEPVPQQQTWVMDFDPPSR